MTYASEVLADAPRAYWRLGDASGTTMTDSSGNARHGTYFGSPTLGTVGLLTGDGDTAITFDGIDDFGHLADATWMDTGSALTVEAWIKTTATSIRQIISRDDGSGSRSFQFRTNGASLEFVKIASGTVVSTISTTINDGVRHHVVATYDGANIRLYKDGTLVQTTAATGSLDSDDVLRVGHRGTGSEFFSGVIDEVAYYGTALSLARIQAHYTAGSTASTTTVPAAVTSWVAPAISIPTVTDNTNQLAGWQLGGYATATVTTPIVADPFDPDEQGIELEAARWLPPPVIVNGEVQ